MADVVATLRSWKNSACSLYPYLYAKSLTGHLRGFPGPGNQAGHALRSTPAFRPTQVIGPRVWRSSKPTFGKAKKRRPCARQSSACLRSSTRKRFEIRAFAWRRYGVRRTPISPPAEVGVFSFSGRGSRRGTRPNLNLHPDNYICSSHPNG